MTYFAEASKRMVFQNFSTDDWIYRGEGNCHVVLALPSTKQILRIRKTKLTLGLYIVRLLTWLSDLIYWYFGTGFREEKVDVKFYLKVMRPLFGQTYVSDAKQVILSTSQINYLEKNLDKHRPEHRKHKILDYGRATLFDDFTCINNDYLPFNISKDTFSFEFKPKQDWEPLLNLNKHPRHTFCMNQYYKLEKKLISNRSNYCPHDLFSGTEENVSKAIKSLIETPQNNFRVFKNGEEIYGDSKKTDFLLILSDLFGESLNKKDLSVFYDLMHECLTKNIVSRKEQNECNKKWLCEWNRQINMSTNYKLEKDSVLEKILSVQMLNTEGASYYNKLMKNKQIKDLKYVNKVLKEVNKHPGTCMKCIMMILGNKDKDLLIVQYLMAAVANDCSFMVTLKRIKDKVEDMEIGNIVHSKYGSFLVRIGIFDLYPKPVFTITKHEKRNKDILDAFTRNNSL
ncbi:unnamed protein product [Brassicogethes aeneus]|uniref:Inositol-pentakisphosphate 2-kinase n=1 Tax=Brassicogethes aeneus TaxID=1431903 RepID=A0A9P0FIQ0_BRAAE|nr:unnamed protein product [Brassicogethes aeneus]